MPFKVSEQYQASVIEIEGKFLGSLEGPKFKETLDELKQAGRTYVVVDLGATDFMDSTGLGTLIGGLTSMRRAGGDVRLANVERRIKALFLMTKLLNVFESYDSVDEAVNSFQDNPPAPPAPEEA